MFIVGHIENIVNKPWPSADTFYKFSPSQPFHSQQLNFSSLGEKEVLQFLHVFTEMWCSASCAWSVGMDRYRLSGKNKQGE